MEQQERQKTRNEIIHEKGFNIMDGGMREYAALGPEGTEYKKIKVGVKSLEDAVLNLGALKTCMPKHAYTDKRYII